MKVAIDPCGSDKVVLGVIWLASVALLVAHMGSSLFQTIRERVWWVLWFRAGRKRLRALTPAEKEILRGFIDCNSRTQPLDLRNGTVSGFEDENIIYKSAPMSDSLEYFPFNIQPWAWRELKKHPEWLAR